ncbi:hypothetical protein HBI49_114090 [Parastagonospora nodorum]|nr:hypothetical protein HBH51_121220 [Parastagonospora nodorum]KAH4037445.1 hypothetical protein HBI09_070680 [Parastagonospora nodorum]KAH5017718.1 hypothetical protein HBI77_056170 [Parastagonospora nodorum]KAH5249190.1 hypothetical protein HBI72_158820 [Parastagonospora nodorum]KAH5363822.1 hypothetical protein HBI49_114090 [Parastagonospora nodorum]
MGICIKVLILPWNSWFIKVYKASAWHLRARYNSFCLQFLDCCSHPPVLRPRSRHGRISACAAIFFSAQAVLEAAYFWADWPKKDTPALLPRLDA